MQEAALELMKGPKENPTWKEGLFTKAETHTSLEKVWLQSTRRQGNSLGYQAKSYCNSCQVGTQSKSGLCCRRTTADLWVQWRRSWWRDCWRVGTLGLSRGLEHTMSMKKGPRNLSPSWGWSWEVAKKLTALDVCLRHRTTRCPHVPTRLINHILYQEPESSPLP